MRRFALAVVFSVAATIAATLGYWTQDRTLPVTSKAVEVVGYAYPGGRLLVRWTVDRHRSCAATKTQIIIDAGNVRWIVPSEYFSTAPGPMGLDTFVTQTDLPGDIPTGVAKLRVALLYSCNPVHLLFPVVDVIPDVTFLITPKDQ